MLKVFPFLKYFFDSSFFFVRTLLSLISSFSLIPFYPYIDFFSILFYFTLLFFIFFLFVPLKNPPKQIKFWLNFIEIAIWHGFSPVNFLHIFRTPFLKNTFGRLLLKHPNTENIQKAISTVDWSKSFFPPSNCKWKMQNTSILLNVFKNFIPYKTKKFDSKTHDWMNRTITLSLKKIKTYKEILC